MFPSHDPVESPARNVDEFAVPDPSLAVGTVPDAMFDAFKFVKDAPEPLKVVAVITPALPNLILLPISNEFGVNVSAAKVVAVSIPVINTLLFASNFIFPSVVFIPIVVIPEVFPSILTRISPDELVTFTFSSIVGLAGTDCASILFIRRVLILIYFSNI